MGESWGPQSPIYSCNANYTFLLVDRRPREPLEAAHSASSIIILARHMAKPLSNNHYRSTLLTYCHSTNPPSTLPFLITELKLHTCPLVLTDLLQFLKSSSLQKVLRYQLLSLSFLQLNAQCPDFIPPHDNHLRGSATVLNKSPSVGQYVQGKYVVYH